MINYPFIDIIIPIYNVEKYLPKCIDSVLAQTYKNLKIILVDDGSSDSCGKICDEYNYRHSNIMVIHKKNGGLSDARNKGLELAKSDYLMFLDSDDWIEPNMLVEMINHLVVNNLDFIACPSIFEYENKSIKNRCSNMLHVLNTQNGIKFLLNRKMNVSAWGKIYKRVLFDDIKYPFGCLHEDIPVIFKIAQKCEKIGFIDTPYHHYRQQLGSISRSMYTKRNYDLYRFVKNASTVLMSYPNLKVDYEGFFFYFVKSLLIMFGDAATREMYKRDYCFYKNILKKNIIKVVMNPTLSIKDKLSIPLLFSPWYDSVKSFLLNR